MSNVSTLETTRENNLRTLKNHSQELQESEKHALDKKELVKSLRHENSILEENISTNKRAIEEHNALIQTLDLQQRELNAKVTKLAGQLIIENAKLEQLRENYNQANDYYETCQNQLTDSQKTLNNKQTARNELENALRTVTESIKTLELQIASTVRSVGETENIVNDLSQNLSEKEGQEKEKSNLLNLQENHLRDLQKEAKEFEERLELQNKRSVLQSSQIEERHQLIAEFENGVIDTKARLSALKDKFVQDSTRLQTLDKEIYQIMAQYKVTEQNLKELDSVTTFNLKQLSGQIPAQKQTLSTIKENVAYMLTEISHKNEKIALAENEIGALQSFIFDKSKESQISHDKLEASNPRIVELRKTLQEYKAQSIEIASKTHELEIAVNNKINEENELSQQIEMKKIKVEETQNMMANIESELFLAKTKNAQKSNELEELKTQENLNSRTVQKNIMHLKELQSDNEMLEQLIAEYSEKITTSDLSLATKHLEYERLTNLNKTLLNKITHLENTLSSPASAYSQKSFDRLNQEIAANQNKVAQLSETVSPASEQKLHFEQVMSEIDPNVTDAMKARLEGRFFGLSIATPKALSAKELTLSEHALETVAMDFETYFGENLEILGSVLSENGDLKIVLGATNIPPHMSVDEVKTKVSTTLKRLSDDHVNAAHIRVRLKVNKAQSPERISIDITYPGQITNRVQSPTT
jgi:chromosome segregation ATPase